MALLLLPGPSAWAAGEDTPTDLLQAELRFFSLVNADRAQAGLPLLHYDGRLSAVARLRSQELLGHGTLVHYTSGSISPAIVDLLDRAQYPYDWAAENLARVSDPGGDPVRLAGRALMASPEHRGNILSPAANAQGVGVAGPAADGSYVYTQVLVHVPLPAPWADPPALLPTLALAGPPHRAVGCQPRPSTC